MSQYNNSICPACGLFTTKVHPFEFKHPYCNESCKSRHERERGLNKVESARKLERGEIIRAGDRCRTPNGPSITRDSVGCGRPHLGVIDIYRPLS